MSAFLLNDQSIDTIAAYYVTMKKYNTRSCIEIINPESIHVMVGYYTSSLYCNMTEKEAATLCQKLIDNNITYYNKNHNTNIDTVTTWYSDKYTMHSDSFDPLTIIKLCLIYMDSSFKKNNDSSDLYSTVRGILSTAANDLSEYDDAGWGIYDNHPLFAGTNTYHESNERKIHKGRRIAQRLLSENYRSVNYRYSSDDQPHASEFDGSVFGFIHQFHPVEIIKLCYCYDYQACETDDYYDRLAHRLVDETRKLAFMALPGFDQCQSEFTANDPKIQEIHGSKRILISSLF